MAEFVIHPDVENYIVEVEWPDIRDGDDSLRRQLVSWFEDGKLILLKNHGLDIDYELLNSFELPHSENLRKLPYNRLLYPKLWKADQRRAIFGSFGMNAPKYFRVRNEIKRVNASLQKRTRDVFRDYRFLREQYSWRLLNTPETTHTLHIDFHSGGDMHYARFFLNIDSEPRVWEVSHRLDEVVRRFHDELDWRELNKLSADQFYTMVGNHLRKRGGAPCHQASFQQGDLWLCDTRTISHGVLSGHRMVATHFWVDPQSMDEPSKRVESRVANFRKTFGAQAGVVEAAT